MYNAMPLNGVVELCKFFNEFQKANPIAPQARM